MSPTVDLLIPQMATGDATSNHTRLIQELLEERSIEVRIVVEQKNRSDTSTLHIEEWKGDATVSILQHSIGSELAQSVICKRLPIVLNYHNVTPASYFQSWHPELAKGVRRGRRQLSQMVSITRRGIADSEFNAKELKVLGIEDVVVSPVLWQLGSDAKQASRTDEAVDEEGGVVLFVGRLAPNKCFEDLIAAFAVLSRTRPSPVCFWLATPLSQATCNPLRTSPGSSACATEWCLPGKSPTRACSAAISYQMYLPAPQSTRVSVFLW